MMHSNSAWSRETEVQETTPLLGSECKGIQHRKDSLACTYPLKGVLHDQPTNPQLESGPSCSRASFHRQSLSAGSLSSLNTAIEEDRETSPVSPSLQCKCSEEHQPFFSRSDSFLHLCKWVEFRLENSGSVARDHLASERTFLAYMRTSLAIASSGVALVQLFSTPSGSSWHKLDAYIRPLGASTVIAGLLVLFIGIARYFSVQAALIKGFFPVARLAIGFVAVMFGALVILTFGILLARK